MIVGVIILVYNTKSVKIKERTKRNKHVYQLQLVLSVGYSNAV